MLHDLIVIWFQWVESWGYWGVFLLMAIESSLVPLPSEVVMPPAAYWASQGKLSFSGVVLAGTLGSYFGSIVNYYLARWVGIPFFKKYGKFVFLPYDKLLAAERWVSDYGPFGIFVGRLLPVLRHLISIPAGILRMPFWPFTFFTLLGAGIWCFILSWFGMAVLGSQPELLNSPEAMIQTLKSKLSWFVIAVLVLGVLYVAVKIYGNRVRKAECV